MKKLLIVFLSVFALISCEDDLDRAPIDDLTPLNAFISLDDLETNLLGMYDAYPTFGELNVNSIATDNTKIGVDNGGQRVDLYNLNIFASGGDQGLYLAYSVLHNRASRVIENGGNLEIDETDNTLTDRRDNILGEAYAMRAFAHFKMFEYFTPDYLNPDGLSVPYVDFVAGSSDNPARDTVSDFGVKFNADLAQADLLLADNNGIDRINKNFITFLRARYALATGDNTNAIGFANDIINNSGASLASGTDYVNMFSDLSDTEVIFKRVYTLSDAARIGGSWFFTGTGGYIMEVSNSLLNAVDATNDPLRYGLIVENGATSEPFGIGKYPGSNGAAYLNDMKEMRISEAYLIVAEASAKESMLPEAAAAIQAIRDNRLVTSPTVAYASQAEALTDVLYERRIELAFEGHRYKDLKRFNEGWVRDAADCAGAAPCSLQAGNFKFTLPFPIGEIQTNTSINENNPGY